MEEKKIVDVLVCKNMRDVLSQINGKGLLKENIIQVTRGDSEWYVLYQRNYV